MKRTVPKCLVRSLSLLLLIFHFYWARFLNPRVHSLASVTCASAAAALTSSSHFAGAMQRVTAPTVMQLDGRELQLWPYDHLSQVEKKNLATKALDLRERLKIVPLLHAKYATILRTGGESIATIRWILQVQADLLTACSWF